MKNNIYSGMSNSAIAGLSGALVQNYNTNNDKNIYKITKFDMLYYSTISNVSCFKEFLKVYFELRKTSFSS